MSSAHARGGGGRERVNADARQKSSRRRAELPVLGPEIVAPLADAMRLVDGDEADAGTARASRRKLSPPSPTSRSGDT